MSFDANGNPTGVALQVGTPGVNATYGVDLTDFWNYLGERLYYGIEPMSDGIYREYGSPYDPPSNTPIP